MDTWNKKEKTSKEKQTEREEPRHEWINRNEKNERNERTRRNDAWKEKMDGQRGWARGRVDVGQIGWVAEIQHFQKAANKGHKGCRIDRKYRFSRTGKRPVGCVQVLLKWCMRVATIKVSFGSKLFPKPSFFWEGRRPKKISISLSLKLNLHPIFLHLVRPSTKEKKETRGKTPSNLAEFKFNLPTWIFSWRYRPQNCSSFSHRSPRGTHFDVTPSRFFDGDIRKHTTSMGSRKSLAMMVQVGDFLPRPRQIPPHSEATSHRTRRFFPSEDPTAFSPLTQKKCCHPCTKKRPHMLHDCGVAKKNAGSFFERVFFQDTLTTRKTIQVQYRDSQVHLLVLAGLVERD